MIHPEEKTDIIDQYLAETLEGQHLQEVKEHIESDTRFRQEVALQQRIIHVVKDRERESLRIKLAKLFNSEFNS